MMYVPVHKRKNVNISQIALAKQEGTPNSPLSVSVTEKFDIFLASQNVELSFFGQMYLQENGPTPPLDLKSVQSPEGM